MSPFGISVSELRRPRDRGRRFDCGKRGLLTANEIARITGMSREGVWQRVRAGITGAELCAPKHDGLRKVKAPCARPTLLVAMKLARAFPGGVPTLRQIRNVHPMTERSAMRWRQALTEVGARL